MRNKPRDVKLTSQPGWRPKSVRLLAPCRRSARLYEGHALSPELRNLFLLWFLGWFWGTLALAINRIWLLPKSEARGTSLSGLSCLSWPIPREERKYWLLLSRGTLQLICLFSFPHLWALEFKRKNSRTLESSQVKNLGNICIDQSLQSDSLGCILFTARVLFGGSKSSLQSISIPCNCLVTFENQHISQNNMDTQLFLKIRYSSNMRFTFLHSTMEGRDYYSHHHKNKPP